MSVKLREVDARNAFVAIEHPSGTSGVLISNEKLLGVERKVLKLIREELRKKLIVTDSILHDFQSKKESWNAKAKKHNENVLEKERELTKELIEKGEVSIDSKLINTRVQELAVYKFDELLQITDCNATFSTANTGVYFPFVPKCDMNVVKIYYNLQSAGTDTVRVAIYSDSSNQATTLLVQGSESTTGATTTGQRSITISSTRLLAGTRYWIAIKNDSGVASFLSKNNVYSNNITREGFTSGALYTTPYENERYSADATVKYWVGDLALGSATINSRAQLELQSTSKGFLPNKLTTTERDAVSWVSGDAGMIIYNTTTSKHQGWNGSTWNDLY